MTCTEFSSHMHKGNFCRLFALVCGTCKRETFLSPALQRRACGARFEWNASEAVGNIYKACLYMYTWFYICSNTLAICHMYKFFRNQEHFLLNNQHMLLLHAAKKLMSSLQEACGLKKCLKSTFSASMT